MTMRADTPTVFRTTDPTMSWFNPCSLTLRTVSHAADTIETKRQVLSLLEALTPDPAHTFLAEWYRHGVKSFGEDWKYLDALSVLVAYAKLARPKAYLEIGVRNGKSLCMVAATSSSTAIWGFDLFPATYAGIVSLGPETIADEAKRLGHTGALRLIGGDSRESVPAFLNDNPDAVFDLIYVDGDHTEEGARIDLENVVPRLAYGGLLVFDDICNPATRYLSRVWQSFLRDHRDLHGTQYFDGGNGVAFALRTAVRP